jgi:hypothetical protein
VINYGILSDELNSYGIREESDFWCELLHTTIYVSVEEWEM